MLYQNRFDICKCYLINSHFITLIIHMYSIIIIKFLITHFIISHIHLSFKVYLSFYLSCLFIFIYLQSFILCFSKIPSHHQLIKLFHSESYCIDLYIQNNKKIYSIITFYNHIQNVKICLLTYYYKSYKLYLSMQADIWDILREKLPFETSP